MIWDWIYRKKNEGATCDINSNLIEAVLKGDISTVKALLDKGANTETRGTRFDQTPLMIAVIIGSSLERLCNKS